MSTGDRFWNGVYPFIDNENGGSIDGMIRAAEANVQRAGEKTLVVPGHGPVGRRADLIAFRDMLVAIRTNVAALKSKGMSIEQVIAARPTADFDAKWGGYVLDGPFFTRIVYDGLRDTSVTSASAPAGTLRRYNLPADPVGRVAARQSSD